MLGSGAGGGGWTAAGAGSGAGDASTGGGALLQEIPAIITNNPNNPATIFTFLMSLSSIMTYKPLLLSEITALNILYKYKGIFKIDYQFSNETSTNSSDPGGRYIHCGINNA
jgi:hypothetical protein